MVHINMGMDDPVYHKKGWLVMMYGNSLSRCVADILSGNVKLEDVGGIVSSTRIVSKSDLMRVVSVYCDSYWRGYSIDDALRVVRYLHIHHKLIQPRLIYDGLVQDSTQSCWFSDPAQVFQNIKVWA